MVIDLKAMFLSRDGLMKEKSTSFGLAPEQIQRLLKIGEDTKDSDRKMNRTENKRQLLRRQLTGTLPLDESQVKVLPAVLGQLCHTMGLLAGETILTLVKDPSIDISLIGKIKQYGRDLAARAKSEDQREVATAIYFAAIANAMTFHDSKISQFSYRKLEKAFSRLIKEKWISSELRVLFTKAHKVCKEKARS
jgi:hypothetical protein